MSKRISLSYCYTKLLNIEDSIASYSFSETLNITGEMSEKTCSAAAEKILKNHLAQFTR